MDNKTIHIVCGPTASGKSGFAMDLAERENGIIINCDSLQIYSDLPILTAQPNANDREKIPHMLYGTLHPNDVCSAGNWREMVIPVIEKIIENEQKPIITGGSGLYIKALMQGLSPMPDIPDDVRKHASATQKRLGNPAFHEALSARDPIIGERLDPHNSARLIRAWEVLDTTGKSLSEWQNLPLETPPAHWDFTVHTIMPERETLYERCHERFDWMINNGALDEVRAFQTHIDNGDVDVGVPLTKALGFQPLCAYLNGDMSKDDAITRAKTDTRHYAKRQMTWFRNQI